MNTLKYLLKKFILFSMIAFQAQPSFANFSQLQAKIHSNGRTNGIVTATNNSKQLLETHLIRIQKIMKQSATQDQKFSMTHLFEKPFLNISSSGINEEIITNEFGFESEQIKIFLEILKPLETELQKELMKESFKNLSITEKIILFSNTFSQYGLSADSKFTELQKSISFLMYSMYGKKLALSENDIKKAYQNLVARDVQEENYTFSDKNWEYYEHGLYGCNVYGLIMAYFLKKYLGINDLYIGETDTGQSHIMLLVPLSEEELVLVDGYNNFVKKIKPSDYYSSNSKKKLLFMHSHKIAENIIQKDTDTEFDDLFPYYRTIRIYKEIDKFKKNMFSNFFKMDDTSREAVIQNTDWFRSWGDINDQIKWHLILENHQKVSDLYQQSLDSNPHHHEVYLSVAKDLANSIETSIRDKFANIYWKLIEIFEQDESMFENQIDKVWELRNEWNNNDNYGDYPLEEVYDSHNFSYIFKHHQRLELVEKLKELLQNIHSRYKDIYDYEKENIDALLSEPIIPIAFSSFKNRMIEAFDQAIVLYPTAEMYYEKGIYQAHVLNDLIKAKESLEIALDFDQHSGDLYRLPKIYEALGDLYLFSGNIQEHRRLHLEAIELLKRKIQFYEDKKDLDNSDYEKVALLYFQMAEYYDFIDENFNEKKALKIAQSKMINYIKEKAVDNYSKGIAYTKMGIFLHRAGLEAESKTAFLSSLKYFPKNYLIYEKNREIGDLLESTNIAHLLSA